MDKPKLAIVIPYYKLTYFEATLKSLVNQTNKNFSVYIGNDNSPEDPQDLIDKYSEIITSYKKFETNLGGEFLTKQWERCIDTMVSVKTRISSTLTFKFVANITRLSIVGRVSPRSHL